MVFSNINIFVLLSYELSLYSIAFSAYIYYIHLRRRKIKAIIYFLIYSLVIFIVSSLTFIALSTSSYRIAYISSQILIVVLFLSPISLLCFILNFLEAELSKVNQFLQQIIYIPALIISAVVLITRSVNVTYSKYGYVLRTPNMAIVDIFYFVTMYLIIIFVIRFEIYKNIREKKSNRAAVILLSGSVLYFISNIVYYPIYTLGIVDKLPIQSIFLFVLYILTSITILITKEQQ
jgi:hypothetical protein